MSFRECFSVASSDLRRSRYTAKTWADVSGLPLDCLNKGETEFLEGLKFELHVDARAFSAWFRLLSGMVQLRHSVQSSKAKRSRGARSQSRGKTPWGDSPSVFEGIVTPLRNAPSMQIDDFGPGRRASDMGILSRFEEVHQGRTVLPLPTGSRSRARSSSPMAYLLRNRQVPANGATQSRPSSHDGNARLAWPPTHQPLPKRTVSEALIDEELGRAAKRTAVSSPAGAAPSPAVPQGFLHERYLASQPSGIRLPPILAPPGGPEGSRLSAPVQQMPSAGRQAELYFYSLAAGHRNGGQLVKQQMPTVDRPFQFGAPFHQASPQTPSTSDGHRPMSVDPRPAEHRPSMGQHLAPSHASLLARLPPDARSTRSAFSSPLLPPMQELAIQQTRYGVAPPAFPGAVPNSSGPPPVQWHSTFSNAGLPGVVWSGVPQPAPVNAGWRPDWGLQS